MSGSKTPCLASTLSVKFITAIFNRTSLGKLLAYAFCLLIHRSNQEKAFQIRSEVAWEMTTFSNPIKSN